VVKEGSSVPVETAFRVLRAWTREQGEPITYAHEAHHKRQLGIWLTSRYEQSVVVDGVRRYRNLALTKAGKMLQ
jgi:hypothetical protein